MIARLIFCAATAATVVSATDDTPSLTDTDNPFDRINMARRSAKPKHGETEYDSKPGRHFEFKHRLESLGKGKDEWMRWCVERCKTNDPMNPAGAGCDVNEKNPTGQDQGRGFGVVQDRLLQDSTHHHHTEKDPSERDPSEKDPSERDPSEKDPIGLNCLELWNCSKGTDHRGGDWPKIERCLKDQQFHPGRFRSEEENAQGRHEKAKRTAEPSKLKETNFPGDSSSFSDAIRKFEAEAKPAAY